MANWHYAKLADVWKHLVLCETFVTQSPLHYVETHAGSGFYPLTPDAQRTYGVYWFLEHEHASPALHESEYRRLLAALGGSNGVPAEYPGSAMLAMLSLGANASYLVCDTDPDSVTTLSAAASRAGVEPKVKVVAGDGPLTVLTEARVSEDISRWTVHIDPFDPFQAQTSGGVSAVELARLLTARGALVVYWYGYETGESEEWAKAELARSLIQNARLWCGNLRYPEMDSDSPIVGCGVVVLNVSDETCERLDKLGSGMASIYENAVLPSGSRGSLMFHSSVAP
jgi:23S rRNA (adenine2030-N6)-methyltransferase